jgi:hypothetical protein
MTSEYIKVICKSNIPYLTGDGFITNKPLINHTVGRCYKARLDRIGWYRVWDDFDEDYIYPVRMFDLTG